MFHDANFLRGLDDKQGSKHIGFPNGGHWMTYGQGVDTSTVIREVQEFMSSEVS